MNDISSRIASPAIAFSISDSIKTPSKLGLS
nr:MAG TPA: hypothetical protein [Caudoviricetes sp.]